MLDHSHPWYKYDDNTQYGHRASRETPSEVIEQDPTQASAPESTDTEMYQAVERDLLITNDFEAGLVRNATKAAGGNKQSRDVRNVQFKEPDEEEEECHRTLGQ